MNLRFDLVELKNIRFESVNNDPTVKCDVFFKNGNKIEDFFALVNVENYVTCYYENVIPEIKNIVLAKNKFTKAEQEEVKKALNQWVCESINALENYTNYMNTINVNWKKEAWEWYFKRGQLVIDPNLNGITYDVSFEKLEEIKNVMCSDDYFNIELN